MIMCARVRPRAAACAIARGDGAGRRVVSDLVLEGRRGGRECASRHLRREKTLCALDADELVLCEPRLRAEELPQVPRDGRRYRVRGQRRLRRLGGGRGALCWSRCRARWGEAAGKEWIRLRNGGAGRGGSVAPRSETTLKEAGGVVGGVRESKSILTMAVSRVENVPRKLRSTSILSM